MHQTVSGSTTEGQESGGSAQARFRPDIEGLRAVAVLAVVLFHADVPGVGFVPARGGGLLRRGEPAGFSRFVRSARHTRRRSRSQQ